MSSIFLVTSGSYSDYGIRGVFSSRKKAKELVNRVQAWNDEDGYNDVVYWGRECDIEEWTLDELLKFERFRYWHVCIMLDTGQIVENHNVDGNEEFRLPFRSEVYQSEFKAPCYKGRLASRVRSTVSMEHAEKVAVEERQRYLRSQLEAQAKAEIDAEAQALTDTALTLRA